MHKLLLTILSILLILGCKSGPDDETTRKLAMSYFSQGMSPEGTIVKEEMIKVLKSYEKEGAPVMTFQVGGMICDMPVLETEQGWIARGISCNGSIYTPEEARQAKKDQFLDFIRQGAEKYKTNPAPPENGTQITGTRVDGDQVYFEMTLLELGSSSDLEPAQLEEMKRYADAELVQNVCSDKELRDAISLGIEIVFNVIASDKTPIMVSTIDNKKCTSEDANFLGQIQ